jgi:hypothetical protein
MKEQSPDDRNPENCGIRDVHYWVVSLDIFVVYLAVLLVSYWSSSEEEDRHEVNNNDSDYGVCLYDYPNRNIFTLNNIANALLSRLFFTTLILNAAFGRRPNINDHHDPLYHRVTQTLRSITPPVFAFLHSFFNFAGGTVFGERSRQASHIASVGLAVVNEIQRAAAIDDFLYDFAMDRSLNNDGRVRRIDYISIRLTRYSVYSIEAMARALYSLMELGVTRFSINDANRLYFIAGIYRASDIAERYVSFLISEYAYYFINIADITIISRILRVVRMADLERPILAVEPRQIDEVDSAIQESITDGIVAINAAASNAATIIQKIWRGKIQRTKTKVIIKNNKQSLKKQSPISINDRDENSRSIIFDDVSQQYNLPSGLTFALSNQVDYGYFRVLLPNNYLIEFAIVEEVHHGGKWGYFKEKHRVIKKNFLDSYDVQYMILRFNKPIAEKKHLETRVKKYEHEKDQNDSNDTKMSPEELEQHNIEESRLEENTPNNNILNGILDVLHPDEQLLTAVPSSNAGYDLIFSGNSQNLQFYLPNELGENLLFNVPANAPSGFQVRVILEGVEFLINVVTEARHHNPSFFRALVHEDITHVGNRILSYTLGETEFLIAFKDPVGDKFIELTIKDLS